MPVPFLSGILKGYRRMKAIEIAQRLAQLNEIDKAVKAYKVALTEEPDPTTQMEAAAYILQFGKGEDYKISYTFFRDLYNRGVFQENILEIMDEAFFEPNLRLMKSRYDRNCKYLSKYPYIFRSDFPKFEDLPLRFYPYDDNSYTPFDMEAQRFGEYVNFRDTVIKHNFFHDLENPILAEDVTSQYELEYLRDNVRKSEDVARENHIYLYYNSWPLFCSYLTCLNLKPLLDSRKFVFLFEDERCKYPIDFKEEFGVDYSQCTVQPVRVGEVTKLVWHTQLSTHNGGDFFNEVFDSHPNLLCLPSMMMYSVEESIKKSREAFERVSSLKQALEYIEGWPPQTIEELYRMRDRTDKDILVAIFLNNEMATAGLDRESRIVPAVFFQPHFHNIVYSLKVDEKNRAVLNAANYELVKKSPVFQGFKYIKTFTPMRRFTTSHGATVRFMYASALASNKEGKETKSVVSDAISERVLNRSFMIDPEDRLYHDSVLVRLEDGKLNPKATFSALSAFLDLPYTESMTYCSENGKARDYGGGLTDGFDPAPIYRTYDEYVNDSERQFIEYFLRDAYEYYGYSFQYYDDSAVDQKKTEEWISGFDTMNHYIIETWKEVFGTIKLAVDGEEKDAQRQQMLESFLDDMYKNRVRIVKILMRGLNFINENGQPLRMMPKLELNPALLEQPLYHGRGKQMEKGTVYFFTGLAGAGKTTIGGMFYEKLKAIKPDAVLKDGDKMREDNRDRDYSTEARRRGAKQTFLMCRKLADQGFDVVYCGIAMYQDVREWNRANIENYREIYVKTSMETLRKRNQKGLYSPGAKQVVGVDLPWDEPVCPDIVIENEGKESPEEIVRRIMAEFDLCSLEGREQA